jgi:hypothetical protein
VAATAGTLYASWNGASELAAWRLLAGASPSAPAPTGTVVARTGFETAIALAPAAGPYVAVQALDAAGAVIGVSAAVKR